jgi:zinc transport system ATP-binding protein
VTEPLLTTRGLSIGWQQRTLIADLDLALLPAERVAIVGANGSGKSTLLRTLLGLIPPRSGEVRCRPGLRLTYLPQEHGIGADTPLTVGEYVAWATLRHRQRRPAALPDVHALLESRGLGALAHRRLGSLSAGERQRVQFARLLVAPVDLVALDEPTAAMDHAAEARALNDLDAIVRDTGATMLFVTHGLQAARTHADRILILDPTTRHGRCVPTADPDVTDWLARSMP